MSYRKTNLEVHDRSRSALRRYQDIVVGSASLGYTLKFEILTGLLGNLPGALGLFLRGKLYPSLFRQVGRGVIFGRNVTLLHPNKISLGDRVVISDGVSLSARGTGNSGVTIGNDVVLGPDVWIGTKNGRITIGNNVNISHGASLGSIEGTEIDVGDYALIAPFTYIGGVGYRTERIDIPIALQGLAPKGGVKIGKGAWLGTRSIVLDGSSVGHDAILGAGAIVTRDIPAFGVAVGVPAKVVRMRNAAAEPAEQPAELELTPSGR